MNAVLLEKINAIGVIRLNRPERFNAFNREMALELQSVLDDCALDKSVRCVYLTGNGKAFCAGQDLKDLSTEDLSAINEIVKEIYNPLVTRIRNIEKPVLCAVNGIAAGAGANIALCCDVVVAAESASFVQAFSKIGLIPDSGGTFFLPRLIGFQKASALMMLGDKVSAIEAEKMGMIYKTFQDETFEEQAMQIALTLSRTATRAIAFTKLALNASLENSLSAQLLVEDRLQYAAAQTKDFSEGVNAFLSKRAPLFKGE
jgi:2-(1,2-epoxy-1,2-dihydrophenyl)acetyl-CoA isomerase